MGAPVNKLKQALALGRLQTGAWLGLVDPYGAEVAGTAGFDWVLILQPTSPFRTAEDIDLAFELVQRVNRSSCVGVRRVEPQLSRNDRHLFNGDDRSWRVEAPLA